MFFSKDGVVRVDISTEKIPDFLSDQTGVLWVDFHGEKEDVAEPILSDMFGFHPLSIDDALQQSHVPRVDDWQEYLYIVLHGLSFKINPEMTMDTQELDIFLGKNFLITLHDDKIASLEKLWKSCCRDQRMTKRGPDYLLHNLIDLIVSDYMPIIDDLDEVLDEIEDSILNNPKPTVVDKIFGSKRVLLLLRRIVAHQRETLNKLARDDYPVVSKEAKVYFRDVYDQLVRMYDITDGMRDLVSGALDTYLSVINNRMNEIMKTLTIITTVFMPLSFVTGFFGMNFFQPIEATMSVWTGRLAFIVMFASMVLVPVSMILWMKRRGWF